jgi:hypothetical protein
MALLIFEPGSVARTVIDAQDTCSASRYVRRRALSARAISRHLRLFRRGYGVSGGSGEPEPAASHYAERVFRKVEQGALPLQPPDQAHGHRGSGARCDGCEEAITNYQIEYELHVGRRIYRLHLLCSDLLGALRQHGAGGSKPARTN